MLQHKTMMRAAAMAVLVGLACGPGAGSLPAAPPNDSFSSRITITGLTNRVTGSNVGATHEPGEPEHAGSAGTGSVWWSWTAPATRTFLVSTLHSDSDTLLGVYLGDSVTSLTPVVNFDDPEVLGGVFTGRAVFRANAGETYQIAVDGLFDTGNIVLSIGPLVKPAPAWVMADECGLVLRSEDFTNQVVMFDFMTTWCLPCLIEAPDMQQLQRELSTEGFTSIAAAGDTEVGCRGLMDYKRTNGLNYPLVFTTPAIMAAFGGVSVLPTKYLVDRDNNIVRRETGAQPLAYYRQRIEPLLRGAPAVRLAVRREGGAVTLAWPATEFGYQVETTSTLPAVNWTTVTNTVVMTGGENRVSVAAGDGAAFFRLRKP